MRRALWKIVACGVAVSVLGLAAVGSWGYRELHLPFSGWQGESVDVVLEPGTDAGSMLVQLTEAGVLRNPNPLRFWLSWRGGSRSLHAGEYRFEEALSPLEVLERIQSGKVLLHRVTVPEGLMLTEIAETFAEAGFGSVEELREAFEDPGPIRDADSAATDLEGYLFPDTYAFPRGTSPAKIAGAMVQRFGDVASSEFRERAAAAGMDLRSAVILASLIEAETSVPDERARISRVFHNRLERGMRLECDPTVIYALRRAGRTVKRLTYDHLEFDSPWNTYRNRGLPRGPIGSPGQASLEAAVSPDDGSELYFVASPDGGHRFSNDYASHRRAVAEWRAYVRSSR